MATQPLGPVSHAATDGAVCIRSTFRTCGRRHSFEENDIYPMEVCVLHAACANGDEIFQKEVGEPFVCALDDWIASIVNKGADKRL